MLLALSAVAVASGCGDAGSPSVVVNSVKWVAFESCMSDAVGAGTSPSATTGVTKDLPHLADDQELHHAVYAPLAYTNVAASVTPSVDGAHTLSRALVQRVNATARVWRASNLVVASDVPLTSDDLKSIESCVHGGTLTRVRR
jgi:hypothetical protein